MKFIGIGDHTTYMDSQLLYLFFCLAPTINTNIVWRRSLFLTLISRMNSGPTKNTFHNTVFGMDIYYFTWRYLMITSPIAHHINHTFIGDIIYIPRNFICMTLNNDLIFGFRIYDRNRTAIGISDELINIRLQIAHPYLLPFPFITGRSRII